ncbi:uncharacterized protein LOC8041888 [Ixodes scapularis]|uniref:uncharacterized protein LOC8041888 n=1 Tax=Ixodes scapularis TaxID=6945 RepID=UPI001C384E49|nr:uncharacterized protein LOC8041888 [Ixodes scapularis]
MMKASLIFAAAVVLGIFAESSAALMTTDPKCHRLRTAVDQVRKHCVYLCHMPEGHIRMGIEEDGTPCKFLLHEGVCTRGLCALKKLKKDHRHKHHDGGDDGKDVDLESLAETIKDMTKSKSKASLDE